MTLYKLSLLGQEYDIKYSFDSTTDKFDYSSISVGKAIFIIVEQSLPQEGIDRFAHHVRETLRRAMHDDDIEVLVISGFHPDTIRFLNIVPMREISPLHRRKIRRRSGSKNQNETDVEVIKEEQEKKKIQEEKTTRRVNAGPFGIHIRS